MKTVKTREEREEELRGWLNTLARVGGTINKEGYRYGNPAELLLDRGSMMGGEKDNPDTELVELISRLKYHEQKQCYYNCAMLSQYADWTYCEGYVIRKELNIPIMHAWLELDGYVYDPTISDGEEDIGVRIASNNDNHYYFGVRLDNELVLSATLELQQSFSVLQDYQNKYPVLKENSPWLT